MFFSGLNVKLMKDINQSLNEAPSSVAVRTEIMPFVVMVDGAVSGSLTIQQDTGYTGCM